VVVRLVEGSLVVWVVRVLFWEEPMSFVGSDGILKARKVTEDEGPVLCNFPACPFRGKGFENVPLLVRGSGRNV